MDDHASLQFEKDTLDTPSIVLVGIFSALICFILILGVQVLYFRMERTDAFKKDVAPGSVALKEMVAEQQGSLNAYRWVDRSTNTVAIPLEQAMQLTVRDMSPLSH